MDEITVKVQAAFATAVTPSARVCEVASMFGLGVDESRQIEVVPATSLTLRAHQVVFITGASGGGKSTLLRLVREQVTRQAGIRVINFDGLEPGEGERRSIVEAIGGTLEQAVRWLSLAGLNDAFVMLRRYHELSDGQRYRYRLARAIATAEQADTDDWCVVLADEFGATLDRLTASVVARNVRKWARRARVCVLAATTHDDLLEPLSPDVLVVQHPGKAMEVLEREAGAA